MKPLKNILRFFSALPLKSPLVHGTVVADHTLRGRCTCVFFVASLLLAASSVFALDRVILDRPVSDNDQRNDYTYRLLVEILKASEPEYGPFEFRFSRSPMERERIFVEMKTGKLLNVTAQTSNTDWEKNLLPIPIPVDKGLSSWHLFLINGTDQARFSNYHTLQDLKRLRVGVYRSWPSYRVFRDYAFNIVEGNNYEGLFRMLEGDRFDFLPRAINEAFMEVDARKAKLPNMVVETDLVLYLPLPRYFFVSPAEPHLAKRIRYGFDLLIKDGTFDRLFMEHHQGLIQRADFCKRHLLQLNNPNLSIALPAENSKLWFNPYSKSGSKNACPKSPSH